MFDKDVAPFQQKYVHLVEDIHNVYGTAKEVSLPMLSSPGVHLIFASSLNFTCCFWRPGPSTLSAMQFHAKGIQMLIDEFNYHVAYKRWDDTFNAIPFKPK